MKTGKYITKALSWLDESIDARVLGIYRILFGLFMGYNLFRYFQIGLIHNMFVLPKLNFKYDGFYWLTPLPEAYLNILLGVLFICTVLITVGILFKWACRFFALGYLYLFLLDKSIYNNHIYLFILVAFLLSFTDADRVLSLGGRKQAGYNVPRWQQVILQVQIVIVYFYGGIAKMTYDWIFKAQPVRSLVNYFPNDSILGSIFNNEPGILFLNFGGLALDLGAPLLLWNSSFRKWSIWLFIGFNIANSRLFQDIGIFPFVMVANLIVFYQAHEIALLKKGKAVLKSKSNADFSVIKVAPLSIRQNTATRNVLIGYFIFQLLFPFRGHFLPNPLDWTTIGNRFSWRMKVDTRVIETINFSIHSPDFTTPVPVEIQTFINEMQILNLSMDPRSVRDFGIFLKQEAILYKTKDPIIKAEITVKYNGREATGLIDPEADLAAVPYHPFKHLYWVYPVPR